MHKTGLDDTIDCLISELVEYQKLYFLIKTSGERDSNQPQIMDCTIHQANPSLSSL